MKVPSSTFTTDIERSPVFDNIFKRCKRLFIQKVPIVEVNLRGHHLTIAKETVSDIQDRFPESNLAGIFSGGEDLPRDSAGRYFIDANAEEFKLLLDTVKYNRKCTTNRVLWVKAYFQHYLGLVGSQLRKYF